MHSSCFALAKRSLASCLFILVGDAAAAQPGPVKTGLPDAPTTIAEDNRGRVYFGLRGEAGFLTVWDSRGWRRLDSGDVGGVAVGTDGTVYYTIGDRVRMVAQTGTKSPEDRTALFGGPAGGARSVFIGRLGDVWVEGCPNWCGDDGEFRAGPRCPMSGPPPIPRAADPFGNVWGLASDGPAPARPHVFVLPAQNRKAWMAVGDDEGGRTGRCQALVVDDLGYVWVAGTPGLMRFDPRKPNAGWVVFPAQSLGDANVTALGLSPNGRALAGFADGSLRELDILSDGAAAVNTVEVGNLPAAPVRAVHTDVGGAIWVVAGGCVWRTRPRGPWTRLPRLPVGNHDIHGLLLDDRLYVAGGMTHYGYPAKMAALDALWAYDARQRRWTDLPPMSVKRGYCGIAALDGEIWVLGGFGVGAGERRHVLDLVEVFSPKTRQWRQGPALDRPRAEVVALAAGKRLYVIGGADEEREFASVVSIGSGESQWRAEPPAPATLRQASGCTLDGNVYVASGRFANLPGRPGLCVYDPKQRAWDAGVPPMPEGAPHAPITAAFKGEIWVMGGWGTKQGRAIFRYVPKTSTWKRGPDLPTPLAWGAAADMHGNLVVAGGAYYSREHHGFIFSDRTYMLPGDWRSGAPGR